MSKEDLFEAIKDYMLTLDPNQREKFDDELRDTILMSNTTPLSNAELREALYPFGNAAQIVGAKRVELYDVVRTLITSQKAIWSIEGFMLGQGYRFVEAPGVRARGYYEKFDGDGNSTVCNEYTAEKRYEKALAQLSTEDVKE